MQAEVYAPSIFSGSISPDGKAISALFGGLQVELSGSDADTVSEIAILRIPVSITNPTSEVFLGYHVALRGFVEKGSGVRAVVFVELGGATKVIEFPYGTPITGNFEENIFSFVHASVQEPSSEGTQIANTLTPPPHLTAVIVLSMQRHAPSDSALLGVDSLDVEITGLRNLPKGDEGGEGDDSKDVG